MSPTILLPWQWPLPSNGALYIQQLWASGDRTREPILMKFGKRTQIRTTWSNIIFLNSKWRTAAMLENIRNVITRLPMDWLRPNLSGHIPSCPRHVPHDSVAMATALNILQLWASGGRTREPILMKFGTQQQIRATITVTWSNIKIFTIRSGGRPPCWKYIRNAITRLPIDRLGRNLGGHIPSCLRHVPHDSVAMATAVV